MTDPNKDENLQKDIEEGRGKAAEKGFPGYPHQPAGDDIMQNENKVSLESSGLPRGMQADAEQRNADDSLSRRVDEAKADPDADVTREDIAMLTAADQNRDMDDPDLEEGELDNYDDDGDPLNEPQSAYGQTGADLDVPGSEDDDRDENAGDEDEENNYYSLGGDNHENLEEDNTSV